VSKIYVNIWIQMTGLEIREYGRRDPSHWPRGTLYPQTMTLTSPTSDGRSVGIVRSWTQATEFVLWIQLIHMQAIKKLDYLSNFY
jgi:hypothetical protein